MGTPQNDTSDSLAERMGVTFEAKEMHSFFEAFEPFDSTALWDQLFHISSDEESDTNRQ